MKRLLWCCTGEAPSRLDLDRPLSFTAGINGQIAPSAEPHAASVMVMPVEPRRQVVAVLLVPRRGVGRVACNGIRLAPGLHELRHADRLEVGHETFWISTEFSVEETQYDPSTHPPEAFCFLTRARLVEGDEISICPGTPDGPCGMIYRRAAWDLACQSGAEFGCPNCGFSPARAAWRPPARGPVESLDRLFELVVRRRNMQ